MNTKIIRVADATNTQLDYLVAKCEGFAVTLLTAGEQRESWARDAKTSEEKAKLLAEWDEYFASTAKAEIRILDADGYKRLPYLGSEIEMPRSKVGGPKFQYTTDPAQMWPIIDREGIDVRLDRDRVFDPGEKVERWYASKPFDTIPDTEWIEYGPTGLIAAARCYVASKLGETVEVPEELV